MALKPGILIIDEDRDYRELISGGLIDAEYSVSGAQDTDDALPLLRSNKICVVLLAQNDSGDETMQVLRWLKEEIEGIQVIILAKHSHMKTAFNALRLGAFDFLAKTANIEEFIPIIDSAYQKAKNKVGKTVAAVQTHKREYDSPIIGSSQQIRNILQLVKKVALSDASVLILGETGSGKELVSQSLHRNSFRADEPFVVVNCGAIPDNLLESEIFGHEKGAFTDAVCTRKGLLEEADGGTIFLDEIAEISLALQVKLLRAVETGVFRRLGSNRELHVNTRIITATNKNLYEEVNRGNFRADLYYRLAIVTITIPPVRERKNDIPLLVRHFQKILQKKNNHRKQCGADTADLKRITDSAMDFLMEYDWPGNVRELKNVVERLMLFAEGSIISPRDLIDVLPGLMTGDELMKNIKTETIPTLADIESDHIRKVLVMADGKNNQAAEVLGITPKMLASKIKDYNLGGEKVRI